MMTLSTIFAILRIRHWVKSFFLFAAPLFGGGLFRTDSLQTSIIAFLSFSLCASSIYVMNDLVDRKIDIHHPIKKKRPIASQLISPHAGLMIAITLFMLALLLGLQLSISFSAILLLYASTQVCYSFIGKNLILIDLILVASGFIFRMIAGALAFQTFVSIWLFICLFLLSLTLATGKRLSEYHLLPVTAFQQRSILTKYSPKLLRTILFAAATASCILYLFYVLEHLKFLGTFPLVVAGFYRYLTLIAKGYGEPTDAILKDHVLAGIVLAWLFFIILIQYSSVQSLFSLSHSFQSFLQRTKA